VEIKENIVEFEDEKRCKFILKIIDLTNLSTHFQTTIQNGDPLIGRLQTNFFAFNSGHIYYGNNAIKIRYDLMKDKNYSIQYKTNEILDYYFDIIQLEEGQIIQSRTPI